MKDQLDIRLVTRRDLLRSATALAGGTLVAACFRGAVAEAAGGWLGEIGQQASVAPADPLAAMRAQMGAAPIEAMKLADGLAMLSGPGGNIAVLSGSDGKLVVDTFVQTVWDKLKATIDAMGGGPIAAVVDTHWHFDHVDNNASFRAAGAAIWAHANTAKRLSESHNLLGMTFEPAPLPARPTNTFTAGHTLAMNRERVELGYIQPAHTDTDIYIRFANANVVHMGDCFFNGMYPFIDAGTGGTIDGMIAAADRVLEMTDATTRIVPGHGPLANRAALTASRDMMVTVRDRVRKLKTSGQPLDAVVKSKPTADLDAVWGKGFMQPDNFVSIVYGTL
jgi:glyoxylase-like metal-dependent hydrolase (beta-lactamase superfamily II)